MEFFSISGLCNTRPDYIFSPEVMRAFKKLKFDFKNKTQNFKFLDAEGILHVDLLPLVKRDYKFDNYKLKTVSEFFIGKTKDPLDDLPCLSQRPQ